MIDNEVPGARSMPAAQRARRKAALLNAIAPEPAPARRWRRLLAPVAGVAVVLATGGAVAYLADREPEQREVIRCYGVAELSSDGFTEMARAVPSGESGKQEFRDPVAACADLFRQGFLRAGDKQLHAETDPSAAHEVPPLSACVLKSGEIAVFPAAGEVCRALGLPRLAE
ncbi:hypothetical protein [Actinoplanes utahensis]|uniref:Uncharacterized protein n=1 Tax=Actinoplanes utahensis TaxID=1869 RepID=A0A0A6UR23_ACTUT|nr:hypothetical protein [Actinoplanes utahensis]KHD77866.1 hypothetical protein MB27_08775 [Actinoplanes utahensis]GIF32448.1 hypothetical protein Aut01nite_54340 [Actinoplanes utahensis]